MSLSPWIRAIANDSRFRWLEAATNVSASDHTTLSGTELLVLTRQPVPTALQQRYDELVARRNAETLTAAEHRELLQLADQVELHNVERLEHLSALARMRGISLTQLMHDLGIEPPRSYD